MLYGKNNVQNEPSGQCPLHKIIMNKASKNESSQIVSSQNEAIGFII